MTVKKCDKLDNIIQIVDRIKQYDNIDAIIPCIDNINDQLIDLLESLARAEYNSRYDDLY